MDEMMETCPVCGGGKGRPLYRGWSGPICTSSFHPVEAVERAVESYEEWKRGLSKVPGAVRMKD